MHKIFELKGMDIDQLQSLASELGIKGFKKMEKDDLVYAILDEEARQNALNVPEKPVQKKRGRPRKAEAKPEVKETDKPDQTEETVKKPADLNIVQLGRGVGENDLAVLAQLDFQVPIAVFQRIV